jgi:predicted nucleic acid-binding protein
MKDATNLYYALKEQLCPSAPSPKSENQDDWDAYMEREERAFEDALKEHPELREAQQRHFELMFRNARLAEWYPDLIIRFADRLLEVDRPVAEAWGRIQARVGRPIPAIDSLIAATAEVHDLTVVTRNIVDFAPMVGQVFSPWETGEPTS